MSLSVSDKEWVGMILHESVVYGYGETYFDSQ